MILVSSDGGVKLLLHLFRRLTDLVEERNASLAVINLLTASPAAATSYNENRIACRHIPCEVGISRSILSINQQLPRPTGAMI